MDHVTHSNIAGFIYAAELSVVSPESSATFTIRLPRAGLPAPELPVEEPIGSDPAMA